MDDLNAVNPNLYPVLGVQIKDETTGKVMAVDTPKKPFLTKADFVTLYEVCGGILHAENPYGQPRDIAKYKDDMGVWLDKTVTLLNHHQIQLLDSELMLWVIMHGENDRKGSWLHYGENPSAKMRSKQSMRRTAGPLRCVAFK